MAYRIHLDNFEGPLDLLLFFIQRDQIDIYDIPIARITDEFLEYLGLLKSLNLTAAGEFIFMAACLMRIKARMLIPRPSPDQDELLEDPRQELVDQLVEYQRFRSASLELRELARERERTYPVGRPLPVSASGANPAEYLREVSLFELLSVCKQVMDRLPETHPLEVRRDQITLGDRIRAIQRGFAAAARIPFRQILAAYQSVPDLIVSFLAVLEMVRSGLILTEQASPFDELYLVKARSN